MTHEKGPIGALFFIARHVALERLATPSSRASTRPRVRPADRAARRARARVTHERSGIIDMFALSASAAIGARVSLKVRVEDIFARGRASRHARVDAARALGGGEGARAATGRRRRGRRDGAAAATRERGVEDGAREGGGGGISPSDARESGSNGARARSRGGVHRRARERAKP